MADTNKYSNIFDKFKVFNDNEVKKFINEIKLFNLTKNYLLFQTNYKSVYQYSIDNKQLNKLNGFNANEFISKFDFNNSEHKNNIHFLALTDNGHVYSWGSNECGQLGNGNVGEYCDEPKLIDSLNDVINICCGQLHSLVLTRNGEVFAFGSNKYGQCGNNTAIDVFTPTKVLSLSNVKAISCSNYHSIALTENGEVFAWGWNNKYLGYGQMKRYWVLKRNITKIEQVMCGENYTLMLSSDGELYFCGQIDKCLSHHRKKISSVLAKKISKIVASIHCDLCVLQSNENDCYIIGSYRNSKNEIERIKTLQKTEFTTIEETYAFYEQITYQSIKLNSINSINPKNSINALNYSKYKNNFIEKEILGCGGFSTVFKCEFNFDNKIYAIKKVSFKPEKIEEVTKEMKVLSTLQSKFVVKYIASWSERNYYLDDINARNLALNDLLYNPNKTELLHIQMELCSLTLQHAITIISNECKTPDNALSFVGYYISSELLYEILKSLHYLHSQRPAIIHRDIKPENILLTNFIDNRFIKLSDFGLSTFHSSADQSHTKYVGTRNYRAPEIDKPSSHYDTKVDVYSLGFIMEQMFLLDINYPDQNHLIELQPKMRYLLNLIKKQRSHTIDDRMNCIEVLNDRRKWILTEEHLLNDRQFKEIISKREVINSIEENFVEFFIQNKYNCEEIRDRNKLIDYEIVSDL